MNIVILVYAKPEVGLGHWYRSLTLAEEARKRGHYVWLVGNKMALGQHFFQVRENDPDDLFHVLHQIRPDFLVVDLQDSVPDYIYDLVGNTKILVLNGVGREEEEKADVAIIQGFTDIMRPNTYSGPEYVILRKNITNMPRDPQIINFDNWFVWGGARDKMSLLPAFSQAMPEVEANLVVTDFMKECPSVNGNHLVFRAKDDSIITVMYTSGKACIATGMVAWELATIGVPTYAFSWSEGHLRFAKRMEEAGLVKAWNGVGLPSCEEIREFLNEPFYPTGTPPDGRGAERIVEIMEMKVEE